MAKEEEKIKFHTDMMQVSGEIWKALKPFLLDRPLTDEEVDNLITAGEVAKKFEDEVLGAYAKEYTLATIKAIEWHDNALRKGATENG